jgi:hypothetical protein
MMLPPKAIIYLFVSLVLIAILLSSSKELRVPAGTVLIWALGRVAHHCLSQSPSLSQYHYCFIFASFVLLAANKDLFYENTFGRFFDLFFIRVSYDPDTPGSGFTDWYEPILRHQLRRHGDNLAFVWRFVVFGLWSGFGFISLPFIVGIMRGSAALARQTGDLERAIAHVDMTGEHPPWRVKSPQYTLPNRDTRYMRLADDIIVACGPGNYDGAISRRRGLSKEFA